MTTKDEAPAREAPAPAGCADHDSVASALRREYLREKRSRRMDVAGSHAGRVELSRGAGRLGRVRLRPWQRVALGGRLPEDRERLLQTIDAAAAGRIPLRPEWSRGL